MQQLDERLELMKTYILMDFTLQEVGDLFNISRERVRQLMKRAKVEYRVGKTYKIDRFISTCDICGRQYLFRRHGGKYVVMTPKQRETAKKSGILRLSEHCRKYKHPNPNVADWQLSQKVVRAYQRGMHPAEITRKFNLPYYTTIFRYLRQWHVPVKAYRGRRTWNDQPIGRNEEKKIAVWKAAQLKTQEQVAKEFNISPSRVGQIVKEISQQYDI